jgi:hypothetical protein
MAKNVSFKTKDGRSVSFKSKAAGRDTQGKVEKSSMRGEILGTTQPGFVDAGLSQRLHDSHHNPGSIPSGRQCCRCSAYGRLFTKGDDDPKLYCTKCAKEN